MKLCLWVNLFCFLFDVGLTTVDEGQLEVLGLFDLVHEPAYIPKRIVHFILPLSYVDESVRPLLEFANHTRDWNVKVVEVQELPHVDLSSINSVVKRGAFFSQFLTSHREAAYRLVHILRGYGNYSEFLSAAVFCRDRVNSDLFVYALSITLLHRNDTRAFRHPPLYQVLPHMYIDLEGARQVREMSRRLEDDVEPVLLDHNFSGTDQDPEHKLWYFREDYDINSHHWHWHIVQPVDFGTLSDRKDRSGELFYYMHSQMVARLFQQWTISSLQEYPAMEDFLFLHSIEEISKDVTRKGEGGPLTLNELERWRDRIYEAIHQGYIVNSDGNQSSLIDVSGTPQGIDLLGRLVEASYSTNKKFYGNLHNQLHDLISVMHDPDGKHKEPPGVMAHTATSIRDPIFFRLHKFVDNIFAEHKLTLPPYTRNELSFESVQVTYIEVKTPNQTNNLLITGWQHREVDLSRGIDMHRKQKIPARLTYLQHHNFSYEIAVVNRRRTGVNGTVRIFIAPKLDENNDEYSLNDQKSLMIEMDKFQAWLKDGETILKRSSLDSEVAMPPHKTFEEIEKEPPAGSPYRGCGWPQHMLVPRGTHQGMQFSLVVMVTDASEDLVPQPDSQAHRQGRNAASYCGLHGEKYPDRRPMGFPWDRHIDTDQIPNLSSMPENTGNVDITIQFADRLI